MCTLHVTFTKTAYINFHHKGVIILYEERVGTPVSMANNSTNKSWISKVANPSNGTDGYS